MQAGVAVAAVAVTVAESDITKTLYDVPKEV
jgi:hypothetical protein